MECCSHSFQTKCGSTRIRMGITFGRNFGEDTLAHWPNESGLITVEETSFEVLSIWTRNKRITQTFSQHLPQVDTYLQSGMLLLRSLIKLKTCIPLKKSGPFLWHPSGYNSFKDSIIPEWESGSGSSHRALYYVETLEL